MCLVAGELRLNQFADELRANEPRILLVEPDGARRRTLMLTLRSHGYDVRAFDDAGLAFASASAIAATGLVASLTQHHTDGIALLAEFRAMGWNGPAVLICADPTPSEEIDARTVGYARILSTPLLGDRLLSTLRELIA